MIEILYYIIALFHVLQIFVQSKFIPVPYNCCNNLTYFFFHQYTASDHKPKRKPRSSSESDDQNSHDADVQSSEAGSAAASVGRRERVKGHAGYMPSDAYRPASQPMHEVMNEEDEEEQHAGPKDRAPDGVVTPADLSQVPWHHAQLYKMYGRNADYYIHPKVQAEKKKVVHPTLKRQKGTFLLL